MQKPNTFKVFQLERHEYDVEFIYQGEDPTGEPIMQRKLTYSGKTTLFLGKSKSELMKYNSIPEWKPAITGEFMAVAGHTSKGEHKFLFDCTPITIIS